MADSNKHHRLNQTFVTIGSGLIYKHISDIQDFDVISICFDFTGASINNCPQKSNVPIMGPCIHVYIYICTRIYPSFSLSALLSLSLCPSLSLFLSLAFSLSLSRSLCLSPSLFIYLSSQMSIYPSIYLFMYLSVGLSSQALSTHLSVYIYIEREREREM